MINRGKWTILVRGDELEVVSEAFYRRRLKILKAEQVGEKLTELTVLADCNDLANWDNMVFVTKIGEGK